MTVIFMLLFMFHAFMLSVYGDTIFLAALSTVASSSGDVIFEREEINPGSYYNNQTGIYTVPYDGIYQFHASAQSDNDEVLNIQIHVDGSVTGSHSDGYNHENYRSATILLQLEAGQEVNVYQANGVYGSTSYLFTYFHGFMISAD